MLPKRFWCTHHEKDPAGVFCKNISCCFQLCHENNLRKSCLNSSAGARASNCQLKSFFVACVIIFCSFFLIFHQHSWAFLCCPNCILWNHEDIRISYLLTSPKHTQAFFLCLPPCMGLLQDVAQQVRENPIYGLQLYQGRLRLMRKGILSLTSGEELEWAAQGGGAVTGNVQEGSGCGTWGAWMILKGSSHWFPQFWGFGVSGARPWCATGEVGFYPASPTGLNSAKIPPEPQIPTPLLLGWFCRHFCCPWAQ